MGILGMEEEVSVFFISETWVTFSFCLKEDKRKSVNVFP